MEPVIEQANLDPPRPAGILARGLPVAVVAHVLLAVALAWGVSWKSPPDPAAAALAAAPAGAAPPATSVMGSGAAPAASPAPAPAVQPRPANPPPVQRPAPQAVPIANTIRPPGAERVQPSFDCARARSTPERLICADPELSRLDRDLGRLHARARVAAPDAASFKRESDAQWLLRERQCRDRDCLLRWYAQRRAQLEAQLAPGNRRAS